MALKRTNLKRPSKRAAKTGGATKLNLADLELKNIRITQSQTHLSIHGGQFPEKTTTVTRFGFGPVPGEKLILADVEFEVATDNEPDSKIKSQVKISFTVQSVFHAPVLPETWVPSEQDIKAFRTTVLLIAWPYARHFVQMMSSMMGIPPLTIPLLRASVEINPGQAE